MSNIPLNRAGTVADSGQPPLRVRVEGNPTEGFIIIKQQGSDNPVYDDWVQTEHDLDRYFEAVGWSVAWDAVSENRGLD